MEISVDTVRADEAAEAAGEFLRLRGIHHLRGHRVKRGAAMKRLLAICILTFGLAALCAPAPESRRSPDVHVTISARRYAFAPSRIEVTQGDVIRITLRSDDIAHSFVIDAFRIEKRAVPGRPVTFEILADRAGTFPFYCNLATEDGCRGMKGELVVR